MIAEGRMTEYGLALVETARQSGAWEAPVDKPDLTFEIPPEFAAALQQNPQGDEIFKTLAPSYQKQYLGWIETAKRPETRAKRIQESIRLLAAGQ